MLSETMAHTNGQTLRILINRYDHRLPRYSVIAADTLRDLVTLTFDLLTCATDQKFGQSYRMYDDTLMYEPMY